MSCDYGVLFGTWHLYQSLEQSVLSFKFHSFPLFLSFYKEPFNILLYFFVQKKNILLHLKFNYYYRY